MMGEMPPVGIAFFATRSPPQPGQIQLQSSPELTAEISTSLPVDSCIPNGVNGLFMAGSSCNKRPIDVFQITRETEQKLAKHRESPRIVMEKQALITAARCAKEWVDELGKNKNARKRFIRC